MLINQNIQVYNRWSVPGAADVTSFARQVQIAALRCTLAITIHIFNDILQDHCTCMHSQYHLSAGSIEHYTAGYCAVLC
jgi:hypothetical protein